MGADSLKIAPLRHKNNKSGKEWLNFSPMHIFLQSIKTVHFQIQTAETSKNTIDNNSIIFSIRSRLPTFLCLLRFLTMIMLTSCMMIMFMLTLMQAILLMLIIFLLWVQWLVIFVVYDVLVWIRLLSQIRLYLLRSVIYLYDLFVLV